jgi:hypothetical protein
VWVSFVRRLEFNTFTVTLVGRRHQKSNHVKGWSGPGQVQSLGDFDGLDAPGLCFLRQWLKMLALQVTGTFITIYVCVCVKD